MIKSNYFSFVSLLLLLTVLPGQISAGTESQQRAALAEDIGTFAGLSVLSESSQSYDETNDPALRKGTENWEQPQGSFFVIPALVVAALGLLMFFSRK